MSNDSIEAGVQVNNLSAEEVSAAANNSAADSSLMDMSSSDLMALMSNDSVVAEKATTEIGQVIKPDLTPQAPHPSDEAMMKAIRSKLGEVHTLPAASTATDKSGVSIPKQRFDEVLQERNATKEELAYYKGKVEAFEAMGGNAVKPAQQPQAPQVDVLEQLKLVREAAEAEYAQSLSDLERRYDEGDLEVIEVPKYVKAMKAIENTYHARLQQMEEIEANELKKRSAPNPADVQKRLDSNPDFVAKNTQLIKENESWLGNVPESLMPFISQRASENLAKQGYNPTEPTPEMRLRFRAEAIRVAGDEFNYRKTAAATPNTPATASNPISDKLRLAEGFPPNVSNAGVTNSGSTADRLLEVLSSSDNSTMAMESLIAGLGGSSDAMAQLLFANR
jgi:hypothetical protein